MEKNTIISIQEMLMREMKRLDDNNYMKSAGKDEVLRSNALTNNAATYIKSVNLSLRIMEVADKNERQVSSLSKDLGIE